MLAGEGGILRAEDALDDQRAAPLAADVGDVAPVKVVTRGKVALYT